MQRKLASPAVLDVRAATKRAHCSPGWGSGCWAAFPITSGLRPGLRDWYRRLRPDEATSNTSAASYVFRNKNGQLVLGDIITGIDSRPVKSQKDLFNILDDCKVRRFTDSQLFT